MLRFQLLTFPSVVLTTDVPLLSSRDRVWINDQDAKHTADEDGLKVALVHNYLLKNLVNESGSGCLELYCCTTTLY